MNWTKPPSQKFVLKRTMLRVTGINANSVKHQIIQGAASSNLATTSVVHQRAHRNWLLSISFSCLKTVLTEFKRRSALATKWLTSEAARARASGIHQITEKSYGFGELHEPARASVSQLQPSIVAPDNSHLQVRAGGGHANLQSQFQVSTGNAFNQQLPTTNQTEYHGLSNIVNNVPHGPNPTGAILYPTSHDPSTGQAAFPYSRYNSLSATHQLEVSDIRPAHHASAYPDHQPPYSQNPVGSSYNSLAQSEPPSTFQQAYNQYPQDGSSNLNATQIASQERGFPQTSLYPTPSNPSTSQVASAYGYRDSRPAAGSSSDQPPYYLQDPAGGSYNSLAQSEPPSSVASVASVFHQTYSRYLQGGSFNATLAQSAPQGPPFPTTTLYPTPSHPSTSQVASAYSYRDSQPAAIAIHSLQLLVDPAGSSYNSLAQPEPPTSALQQAHGQYLQGSSSNANLTQSAPQGPAFHPNSHYLIPSNPSTSQVTSAYGYPDSQPAVGTSYDQPPHLQYPAGGSYSRPTQSEPPSFTLSTSQQSVDEVLHDGSSNIAQTALKVPTLLPTVLDPSTSQAAPTQSSWSALSARSSDDPEQPLSFESQGGTTRMTSSRQIHRKLERSKRILSTCSPVYLSSASMSLVRSTSPLPIDNTLVKQVKLDASKLMNTYLIRETLYPTKNRITALANAALKDAIANGIANCTSDANIAMTFEAWKLRPEGQGTLIRLKGVVKQIHRDCQGTSCARGAMAGAHYLSVGILFKNTEDIIPSRKRRASTLLLTNEFLDTIIQRDNCGTFRVPFGNSALFVITEHILVDQGYRQYTPLESFSDSEPALRNIVALSATICELEILQCSLTGWFKPIDLYAHGRTVFAKMTKRMALLEGVDLQEFRGMLSLWHLLLKSLPPCEKQLVHTKRRTDFAPELVKEHLRTSVHSMRQVDGSSK
ncbi:hypothetical protein EDD22DRAFT_849670 [Suillus occidentalis]|nr:hypothetical protein EDD22DRAFT_849670 [Suillus occidentalis]